MCVCWNKEENKFNDNMQAYKVNMQAGRLKNIENRDIFDKKHCD